MKLIRIIPVLIALLGLSSCQKYLEKPNRIQASISTADQLLSLMDNVASTSPDWAGQFAADFAAAYYTDDAEFNLEAVNINPIAVNLNAAFYYTFDSENLIKAAATDPLWANAWQRVLTANVVLNNVESVTGSEEIKNIVRANAYFARAYAYWSLVNHYCQPYAQSTLQTLGLPIRKTNGYTESLKRVTLKETYDFIMADISEAQKFVTYKDVQPAFRWRISKPAIAAFLSRYYLFTGDYNNALAQANIALAASGSTLVDYNNIPLATNPSTYRDSRDGKSYTVTFGAFAQYTSAQYLAWPEFYYTSFTAGQNTGTNNFNASPALISNYDTPSGAKGNDLRIKLLMPDNSGFTAAWSIAGLYGYKMFSINLLNTGPSVPEILLNKAEAAARLNDFVTAGTAINMLRAKRFVTGYAGTNQTFTATNALELVLRERRRELPFGFRFFDIRRFAYNETPADDITVTRTFYNVTSSTVDRSTTKTYTLPVKSTRYMIPIPNSDILQSQGMLVQNDY